MDVDILALKPKIELLRQEQADMSVTGLRSCTSLIPRAQTIRDNGLYIVADSEQERAMQKRRKDRKEQYHKQVWTKEAHGGPYRKVGFFCEVLSCSTVPLLQSRCQDFRCKAS